MSVYNLDEVQSEITHTVNQANDVQARQMAVEFQELQTRLAEIKARRDALLAKGATSGPEFDAIGNDVRAVREANEKLAGKLVTWYFARLAPNSRLTASSAQTDWTRFV